MGQMFLLHPANQDRPEVFSQAVLSSHIGKQSAEREMHDAPNTELIHCFNLTKVYFSFMIYTSSHSLQMHNALVSGKYNKTYLCCTISTLEESSRSWLSQTICSVANGLVWNSWISLIQKASSLDKRWNTFWEFQESPVDKPPWNCVELCQRMNQNGFGETLTFPRVTMMLILVIISVMSQEVMEFFNRFGGQPRLPEDNLVIPNFWCSSRGRHLEQPVDQVYSLQSNQVFFSYKQIFQ